MIRQDVPVADMMAWTDKQLVRACLDGSEQAWSCLIDKYKNLIFSIPIKRGMSRDDAADIFQQVCLKLLSELPNLRDPDCLAAWLIKVTSHNCFHWVRRERLDASMATGIKNGDLASTLPEEFLLQVEREQLLREAVLQISPRCRDLIRMLFYQTPAISYDDVARELGLARGSIGFIRMRCLKQLRSRLKERGFR
jgi:RNA polymerase sigma factor (sigma-70 family)